MIDRPTFWIITLVLGAITYVIRLSFLALSQERPFSPRVKRLLDFVPVTVLPALIAPIIVFPQAAGGDIDPLRIVAAGAALGVGLLSRSVLLTILAGMAVLLTLGAIIPA